MKTIIKTALALFVTLLLATQPACAQDEASKTLNFVYIAHEPGMPSSIYNKLRDKYDGCIEFNNRMIVYLSNGDASRVALVNLKDKKQLGRDSENAFYQILSSLQEYNSHDVFPKIDMENIIDLFDMYNFVDDSGDVKYRLVTFDFYVGPSFWKLRNNEHLIAHLYHVLGINKHSRDKVIFNVFLPEKNIEEVEEEKLFGDNNLDDINAKIKIMQY